MTNETGDSLRGVSAVIVEDNLLVADSIQLVLESFDCEVTGVVGTVEKAHDLIQNGEYDIAILDIDLRGRSVVPVVADVKARDKAFLFLSGYGDEAVLPDELQSIPRLRKPIDPGVLVDTIKKLVA